MRIAFILASCTSLALASACTPSERPPVGERACMPLTHAGAQADCGEDFCGKKSYNVAVNYVLPNGFECTTPCENLPTGPGSQAAQNFQYSHDGLYFILTFGPGVFASPSQYTSKDLSDTFQSGYLAYDIQDGAYTGRVGLNFAAKGYEKGYEDSVVDHVGFEGGQLVFKVHGATNTAVGVDDAPCGGGQDCSCHYQGDEIALSFDIHSTMERPL
ncbi:MAG: hypothetical protein QM778_34925 [Myxococcales bacterium]